MIGVHSIQLSASISRISLIVSIAYASWPTTSAARLRAAVQDHLSSTLGPPFMRKQADGTFVVGVPDPVCTMPTAAAARTAAC